MNTYIINYDRTKNGKTESMMCKIFAEDFSEAEENGKKLLSKKLLDRGFSISKFEIENLTNIMLLQKHE